MKNAKIRIVLPIKKAEATKLLVSRLNNQLRKRFKMLLFVSNHNVSSIKRQSHADLLRNKGQLKPDQKPIKSSRNFKKERENMTARYVRLERKLDDFTKQQL
jgi:hypothetical protein